MHIPAGLLLGGWKHKRDPASSIPGTSLSLARKAQLAHLVVWKGSKLQHHQPAWGQNRGRGAQCATTQDRHDQATLGLVLLPLEDTKPLRHQLQLFQQAVR